MADENPIAPARSDAPASTSTSTSAATSSSSTSASSTARVIVVAGRYELVRRLGAGGMGEVHEAFDQQLRRRVAIKRMSDHSETARERFVREALTVAQLAHRNIVTVFDGGTDGETPYLVMELLEGATLRSVLTGAFEHGMPWRDTLPIVASVARALEAAHARKIVHRDLKPANVMLLGDAERTVKVLDFGLAIRADDDEPGLTRAGTVVGTAAYLAPEQLDAGDRRDIGCATDMHALGALWWEMLTGGPLFEGDNDADVQRAVREHHIDHVRDVIKDVDPVVDALLWDLLQREPNMRPTASTLLAELAPLHGGQAPPHETKKTSDSTQAMPKNAQSGSSSTRRPWWWRSPIVPGAATAVIAAAVVLLAYVVIGASTTSVVARQARRNVANDAAKALVRIDVDGPLHDGEDPRLVDLGRRMFDDERLSQNGSVACTSCHVLDAGGSLNMPLPNVGVSHQHAPYNAAAIWNVPRMFAFGWRGDATFADLVERALTKPPLMGNETLDNAIARAAPLYADDYARLGLRMRERADFVKPFAAYLAHIEPDGTDADRYFDGNDKAIPDVALRGARLFEEYGCTACHQGRGVGGNLIARFGVMVDDPFADRHTCDDGSFCRSDGDCAQSGGGTCTHPGGARPEDYGKDGPPKPGERPTYLFRVPSLRNVALTAPYFHDGSARTLDEAVRTMAKLQLGRALPEPEVQAIAAFLRTLSGQLSTAEVQEIATLKAAKAKR